MKRNIEDLEDEVDETKENDDHFQSTYRLKENYEYEKNGYHYETDSKGRIKEASGVLHLGEGKRYGNHQLEAGHEDRKENDEGGHIIASRFEGSGKIDNLVAMDKGLTRNEYKALEESWAKDISEGKKVDVDIKMIYKGESERPDRFRISYRIENENGDVKYYSKTFRNGG